MNGRYFAGKQIMFEFIGVTRWKVAICGEYMKSRLKTCSHGNACNFIHCFGNPGGDYEWANWDNPPPRYWIKKMAALFGPCVEAEYVEQKKLEQCERSRDPSRRRTPTDNRHQSRRSHGGTDTQNSGYGREDRCSSHSPRREHSSKRRKGIAFRDRHERYKEKHNTEVHGYNGEHCSRGHDSGEDSYYEHSPRDTKHHMDFSRPKKRDASFNEKEKSERNCRIKVHKQHGKRHRSSDHIADHMDDNRERSNKHLSEYSCDRYIIDAQDRYVGTCSADLDSESLDGDTLENTSWHHKHSNGRTEHGRSKTQHYGDRVSHAHEQERKEDSVRKRESSHQRYSSDEAGDARKTSIRDLHCEENHYRSSAKISSSSSRKRSRSDRKVRHRENECNEANVHKGNLDVEYLESNRSACNENHSRSRTPIHRSRSPRRERSHSNRS